MSVLLVETVLAFLVSILVRKPSQIKRFPYFLRSAKKVQTFCSRMTKRTPACLESCRGLLRAGAFPQRQVLVKTPGAIHPDANVGTDDFSAQRRRSFCHMQRLITVEGYGQICMGSTFGNLAGIRVDAAGQVYGQHKGTTFVQTAYQPAGSKTGRPQFTMEPGAIESIHSSVKTLGSSTEPSVQMCTGRECRRSKLRMASAVSALALSPEERSTFNRL